MRSQAVVFTAVPTVPGTPAARTTVVSVHVAPRLRTDENLPRPSLSMFPDWLDWPARLGKIDWALRLEAPQPQLIPATMVSKPRSDLWKALLPGTTYVRPQAFNDLANRKIRSYPVRNVTQFLLTRYQRLAVTNPSAFPSYTELTGPDLLGPISYDRETGTRNAEQIIEQILNQNKAVPPGAPAPALDFWQLRRFHRPRGEQLVEIKPPDLDFHDILALTSDYPELQRLLGIVVDLQIPSTALSAGPLDGQLSAVPSWSPSIAASTDQLPRVRVRIAAGALTAAPRAAAPELVGGLLPLGDTTRYAVIGVDPDGAAVKALDLAVNLQRSREHVYAGQPDSYSLPSLRTGGFSVARVGRAATLAADLQRAKQIYDAAEANQPVLLDAEDLVRGYRVDVYDTVTNAWHQLNARQGKYTFTGTGTDLDITDEGTLTLGTTSAADGSSPDLYLQETMFRWNGWSLSAPKPGTAIDPADNVDKTPEKKPNPTVYPLQVSFRAAPGTLPALRFGRTYRFRMRAVDIAGRSVRFTASPAGADPATLTPPVRFGRYEPVQSPVVALRRARTTGEDVGRLVIRSNYDTPAKSDTQAHLVPPQSAQIVAEQHGRFDSGGALDPAAWAQITSREGGSLEASKQASPDPGRIDQVHFDVDQLELPYLPDPIARGVAVQGLPGQAGVFKASFAPNAGDPWFQQRPVRMKVQEGAPGAAYDPAAQELKVSLPKAARTELRVSCYVYDDDLPQLAVWQLIEDSKPSAGTLAALHQAAVEGRHWMMTPYRTLTLVHAVRQPLATPEFGAFQPQRAAGSTFAAYTDVLDLHRASTARVDVYGEWTEQVDRGPGTPAPVSRTVTAAAFGFTVTDDPDMENSLPISARHEFGDTRHRTVTYKAVATSAFTHFFAERKEVTLGAAKVVLDVDGLAPGSVRVCDEHGEYAEGRDYTVDLDSGTLARTDPSGIPLGHTVTVDYAVPPFTRETTAPVTRNILATAKPAAPVVAYTIPQYRWNRIVAGDTTTSIRKGGGLRVYLERPWFTSGDGELLGVVIDRTPAAAGARDRMKALTTLVGEDPVYLTAGNLPAGPTVNSFPNAVVQGTALDLEGAPEPVDVAGHAVAYDPARGLWYCDIDVNLGPGYTPFVRLALVRYQPDAIQGCKLSAPVVLDFTNLAPDRTVTVQRDAAGPGQAKVTMTGPAFQATGAGPGPGTVVVTAQVRDPGVGGELGWVDAGAAAPPVTLAAALQPGGAVAVWQGTVPTPSTVGRLVVEEFETLTASVNGDGSGPAKRLAFTDVVPLS
ncbi:hypothetical protein ABT369_50485 [Dactylosporangium sp. NPDC000244]|uniref:hypothetical protein n=1 Tax=Dactylosporangium sp. NPDC000244 TaxID=3154365 RepID=UPI00332518F8